MFSDALILGGLGQMGTLLYKSLRDSGISVTLVDVRSPALNQSDDVAFLQSDLDRVGPALQAAISTAGCVCVCLPEKTALSVAARVGELMPSGSLWVDTLSVKSGIVHELAKHAGRLQILSINPMFAPVMGWNGSVVAMVEMCTGHATEFFKELLAGWGARLEPVTAEEHDRLTADPNRHR